MIKLLPLLCSVLYDYNARKFVIVGVWPVGCIPLVRVDDKHEECNKEMNHLSVKYNGALISLLKNMESDFKDILGTKKKKDFKDIHYSYFDGYSVLQSLITKPTTNGTTY